MFCPNCGAENKDGSKYCTVCGTELPVQSNKDISTPGEEEKPASKERKGFFRSPGGIVTIIVIIAAVVVVVFLVFWMRGRGSEAETAPVVMQEQTTAGEADDIVYDVNNLSQQQEDMLGPMDTLIYVGYEVKTGSGDWHYPDYFWGSIWFLIGTHRDFFLESGQATRDDSLSNGVIVTEDVVKECASALFSDFDGELPLMDGVEISSIYKEGEFYHIGIGDRGEGEGLAISSWVEHPDGSCTVEVEHVAFTEEEKEYTDTSKRHRFELVKNAYTESEENPLYTYSIAGMETFSVDSESSPGTDTTAVSGDYILPDSDTRYYTESELNGLTKEQLRLARNEIYARHGRLFDAADLQDYFNGQAWYNGTIAASDFTESMLNEYEKANVKTIQSVEDALSSTTSSTQTRQANDGDNAWFASSWDVIQDYGLYTDDWLYHNIGGNAYTYSELEFELKPATMEDMGDYYSVQAVFEKPLTITKDLTDSEQYTVCIDELSGETKVLTCYDDEAGLYLIDDQIEVYDVHPYDQNPNLYELWYDTDDKRYVPFYEGVLRISKDAVMGASITHGPYETVNMHSFDQVYTGLDGVAFDSNGYVTQLLWLGD